MDRPAMMMDNWCFGLLLVTGQMLVVEHINRVSRAANGDVWIDVEMYRHDAEVNKYDDVAEEWRKIIVTAPVERTKASINVKHIVLALELGDT